MATKQNGTGVLLGHHRHNILLVVIAWTALLLSIPATGVTGDVPTGAAKNNGIVPVANGNCLVGVHAMGNCDLCCGLIYSLPGDHLVMMPYLPHKVLR